MKKVVGIVFLSIILIATSVFAAYPAELENAELAELENANTEENVVEQPEETAENPEELNQENSIEPISIENETAEEPEIIYDDVYGMDEEIIIDQIIDGNVYVMAETVKIDGAVIYGSVYVMAQNIEITNSEINGSLYVLGEKVDFSGTVNDVYACASNVNFNTGAFIWRSARTVAENIKMEGSTGRDFLAAVNNLTISEGSTIGGKLNYTSENEASISEQSEINEINFVQDKMGEEADNQLNIMDYVYEVIGVALKTAIIALFVVFLVNKFNNLNRTDNIAMDLLKYTGKGALCLVVIPIIVVLLWISIVGTGLGFVLLALYLSALYITISLLSIEIAHRILSIKKEGEIKKAKIIAVSVLISIVIWAISLIPVIGGIIKLIAVLIGLGILYTLIFPKITSKKVVEK